MASDVGDEGRAAAITTFLVLGIGLLALFLDVPNWWLVFVIGYTVVLPIVAILFDSPGEAEPEPDTEASEPAGGTDSESKQDALETLRERYARGELSEAQFERKLERLLETETLEDARARIDRSSTGVAEEPEPERE